MCRHRDLFLRRDCVLRPPQTCDSLPLRIEVDSRLSIKIARPASSHALLVACETKHGQRHWDWDVDAQLTRLNFFLEPCGRCARASEDGRAIAIWIGVDQSNGLVSRIDIQANKNGAEDLFGVAFHMRLHICDDRWADLRISSEN